MLKRYIQSFTLLGLIACSASSYAAYSARVISAEFPAWVSYENKGMQPIHVGMNIYAGAQIHTGAQGKALLQMPEGSRVKLGNNARFGLNKLTKKSGIWQSSLSVLTGAFRFTTALVAKKEKRNINLHIGTITAGIRGTDVWGKSSEVKDIVCLLEGKIAVSNSENKTPHMMEEAMMFYVKPKTERGMQETVSAVLPEQVTKWAQETDIENNMGAVMQSENRNHAWSIIVTGTPIQIQKAKKLFYSAGYPIRKLDAGTLHLSHLNSEEYAQKIQNDWQRVLENTPLNAQLTVSIQPDF
jgi:hypothetical protein